MAFLAALVLSGGPKQRKAEPKVGPVPLGAVVDFITHQNWEMGTDWPISIEQRSYSTTYGWRCVWPTTGAPSLVAPKNDPGTVRFGHTFGPPIGDHLDAWWLAGRDLSLRPGKETSAPYFSVGALCSEPTRAALILDWECPICGLGLTVFFELHDGKWVVRSSEMNWES